MPPAVVLAPLSDITPSTIRLNWSESTIPNFKQYRIYRAQTSGVSESSTLVAVITNRAITTFVDTGLVARNTYYYRIYTYDENDVGVGSNQSSDTTAGVPVPWFDDFTTNRDGWTFTGTWTILPGVGIDGSSALADSAGDYPNNATHYAQIGIDPRGMNWPVLRFSDRHAFADNDWGRVFVSPDAGASWTAVYGVSSTRTNWATQIIDLSPWKNTSQLWIRFQVNTDGSTQADGWYIDDVAVYDYDPGNAVYPFFDGFETGMSNWLRASWEIDTNLPYAGEYTVRDTRPPRIPPDTQLALVLAKELNLSNATNPLLTFFVRGQLWYRTRFRAQISTNNGLNWIDLSALNYDWNQGWTKFSVPLTPYTNKLARLRFIVWSESGSAPDQDLFLDNIAVGDPAPGTPTPAWPTNFASVDVARPTLAVYNAIDYQSDPLFYQFEVYADDTLSNLVAQVPAVASGPGITTWTVDVNLPDHAQYWWRARASDGTNTGPWMDAISFFVNETNHPPTVPMIAGPPNNTLITNLDQMLLWYPCTDPDEGGKVISYHIQIALDEQFQTIVVNAPGLPAPDVARQTNVLLAIALNDLPDIQNLQSGNLYYWRISAQDDRWSSSPWSEVRTIQFGPPTPCGGVITGITQNYNGQVTISWTGTTGAVYVEFSATLDPPQWYTVAGPLYGTNWTFTPVPSIPAGFYRLRAQ